jgi:two-component sensor histidine kinase/tetratricopeptide (TPR) repeat protein
LLIEQDEQISHPLTNRADRAAARCLTWAVGAFCLIWLPASSAQTDAALADSLIRQLPLLRNDTSKAYIYRDISYYLLQPHPDSALIYSRRGYELARKLSFLPGQIWNLNQQGYAYELLNDLDLALLCYEQAIELARCAGDPVAEARMLNVLGTVYHHQGDFAEALAYYNQALRWFEELDDLEGRSQALNNLGIIYRVRRNYLKAVEVYGQSIAIKRQLGDRAGEAATLRNLGLAQAYLGQPERSLSYLHQAIAIHKDLDNPLEVAQCEVGVGSALYTLGRFEEAEAALKSALQKLPESSALEYSTGLLLVGSLEVKRGEFASGLAKMQQAHELALAAGRLDLLRQAEKELALAYEANGLPGRSAPHWKNYAAWSDSLASEQQQWAIEEMMARYESREKENRIRLQALALAEESAKNKYYLAVGLLFVLLFAGALAYSYKRAKANRALRQAHLVTQAALRDKELLLKEMHHRVKNNLQMLNSLLSIQSREISDPKAKDAVQSSRSRVHSIALIHQLLYAREDFRQIDMRRFVQKLIRHCQQVYGLPERDIAIAAEVGPLYLDIDAATPIGLIINELIVNSIKHAFPAEQDGQIFVCLREWEGTLQLQVRDNGQGFQPAAEKSDSFGLKLIHTLAQRMGATLDVASDDGTTVTFLFPDPKRQGYAQ